MTLAANELDAQGFVADFDVLHERVLVPCHLLLDHSLAVGEATYAENAEALSALGSKLVASRHETLGDLGERQACLKEPLGAARNEHPGGIKVAVFPFSPTSERLAEWLYAVATERMADARVHVASTRIYETLHPTESIAQYVPSK